MAEQSEADARATIMQEQESELGVPELPSIWRQHYAQIAYAAAILGSFIETYRERRTEPDASHVSDPQRSEFLLGLYVDLAFRLEKFHEECHSVWLAASPADFRETWESLRELAQNSPLSGEDQVWLRGLAAGPERHEGVARRAVKQGRPDIVEAWCRWLDQTASDEKIDTVSREHVAAFVAACQTLERTLGNALR